MKYILLMSGTKAGVGSYLTWSQKDRDDHMAVLQRISNDLTASGEFVATQGLSKPHEAMVVRGEKDGVPITDGVFPEAKEFLWGFWIVEVPHRSVPTPQPPAFPPRQGQEVCRQTCRSR